MLFVEVDEEILTREAAGTGSLAAIVAREFPRCAGPLDHPKGRELGPVSLSRPESGELLP